MDSASSGNGNGSRDGKNPKPDKGEKHRRSKSAMVSSFLSPSSIAASAKNKLSSSPSSTHSHNTSITGTPNSSQHHLDGSDPGESSNLSQNESQMSLPTGKPRPQSLFDPRASMERPPPAAKSIEETVRTFRLYEALRNGDTAAILRAIRDGSPQEGGQRSSITAGSSSFDKSSILGLAVQCAELPVIEYILSNTSRDPQSTSPPFLDVNHRDSATGNTPLHIAAHLGRSEVVQLLLKQNGINDALQNYKNQRPLDVSRSSTVFNMLQLAQSLYLENVIDEIHKLVEANQYDKLKDLLEDARVDGLLDINALEPPNAPGSTLLHEAARRRDTQLIQLLLLHRADPFRRDKKGKLPQDVTKDERTRQVLKKSPAAQAAARGIEERAVLGSNTDTMGFGELGSGSTGKDSREIKGYLKKWTNYTSGYKLRWFVLENGVLSYYKNQDDIGSACRGAVNMRIARLHMDPNDKLRFEVLGKGSIKYHLKANHQVEAKRWYWALNNAIQYAKDEERAEKKQKKLESERMERLREQQHNEEPFIVDLSRHGTNRPDSVSGSEPGNTKAYKSSIRTTATDTNNDSDRPYLTDAEMGNETAADEDDDDDDSSRGPREPPSSDQLTLMANSARVQLDLLSQVALALQFENQNNPGMTLGDPSVLEAMASYETAVNSLKGLVGELVNMSRERDEYWRYRLEKEVQLRRIWEENMTKLAQDQEELEDRVHGERERRKKTKRALQKVLRGGPSTTGHDEHAHSVDLQEGGVEVLDEKLKELELEQATTRRDIEKEIEAELSDTDSDLSDEFFDAVDAGEVEVITEMPVPELKGPVPGGPAMEIVEPETGLTLWQKKMRTIEPSFLGYEDPPRKRLTMDEDNRPKISLWGILKSMIGKDMTKMTLPVSFNEPTSLLHRVAEDMEYTDLLDIAADRSDPAERMVYVAAFAASEYASTTLRVAKPFNPLLGETYEYCRPDKKYRFFVEQVSHHPPIGAAYAEGEKWDYWGESAVKSKFYGKSFEINPLGTWFLRLRPVTGGEELYTWKKVTTSVVGIITGSPTVDNYGLMEIKNWTTGEVCQLDFKQRGWSAKSAFEVKGRVLDSEGTQTWSVGGRWNDKLYARISPGYDATISPPATNAAPSIRSGYTGKHAPPNSAFLVWQVNPRPSLPFNLTPFALTLNALPENLKPFLCPTDSRFRPDQRAMEEGEYDFAAEEKNRVEEKQRAKRRWREEHGEVYQPRWFKKGRDEVTGEECWLFDGEYWELRERVAKGEAKWTDPENRIESIFFD